MYSYFAVVNTFCNAAGELVSERLVPEPYVWDDDNVPPMPTDPPPECFVPTDDGTPKYQAYVPKTCKTRVGPGQREVQRLRDMRVHEEACEEARSEVAADIQREGFLEPQA